MCWLRYRPFAQLWPGNEVRGIAGWNWLWCMCFSLYLSFRFSSALELFWRYTTPPFLKYSFRRVMLQLEFQDSKCKREGLHWEQSQRHTGGVQAVCMPGDDLIYRHLLFKKLGFFAVQLWPIFSQVLFQTSNAPTWVWMIQTRWIVLRTVRNEDEKNSFLLVENAKIICRLLLLLLLLFIGKPQQAFKASLQGARDISW